MQRTEQGFISIFMVVIIVAISLLSVFFIAAAQHHHIAAKNFFAGFQAQNSAEAGIQEVFAKLNTDKDFIKIVQAAEQEGTLILKSPNLTKSAGFYVYIARNKHEYTVFSVGNYDEAKRQVIAYLEFSEEEQLFSIIRIDNQ